MSNGRAERMVRAIKGTTGKTVHGKPSDGNLAVPRVLYGCRRRSLVSGSSLFQLSYKVSFRVPFEHLLQYEADKPAPEGRIAEDLAWLHIVLRMSVKFIRSFIKALIQKYSK